jgi:ComF family protein
MKTTLQKLWSPPTCETCSNLVKAIPSLCESCRQNLKPLKAHCEICALPFESLASSPHRCAECLRKPPSFNKVTSVFEFAGPIIPLLHGFKFGRRMELARLLAIESREKFSEVLESFQPDLLLPIPLSWWRRFRRGFNQSYLLTDGLIKQLKLNIPILTGMKRKQTAPQAKKSREERLKALKQAFRLSSKNSIKGKTILVIDDIMTTGATAQSVSSLLKKSGAREIQVFTIARVRRHVTFS